MDPLKCPIVVDADPDYEGYFSLWTNIDGAINAELAGKIGSQAVADKLAKLWNDSLSV